MASADLRVRLIVTTHTSEELYVLDMEERSRQRAARIDALAVDRSRFRRADVEQLSRLHARDSGLLDDEAKVARKRGTVDDVTRLEALRALLRKAAR